MTGRRTMAPYTGMQSTIHASCHLVRKTSWQESSFGDVSSGEKVSNYGYVDMAKLQDFSFTMIAAIAYAVMLGGLMAAAGRDVAGFFAFPDPREGPLAITAIGHTGYQADKAFTHSAPADGPTV